MTFKDSKLYYAAAIVTLVFSASIFFFKLLLSPPSGSELIYATASIMCMIGSCILFILYLDARIAENRTKSSS